MTNKPKQLISIILILLIAQVGLIYLWLEKENNYYLEGAKNEPQIVKEEKKNVVVDQKNIVHDSYYKNIKFYNEAYQAAEDVPNINEKIYGAITPHHLLPKDKIAKLFLGLEEQKYDTIILIGPNHYDEGNSDIITSKSNWNTPYGELAADTDLIDKLTQNKIFAIDENPFYIEHSISGLVPFIKKSLPDSKIVPIILKIGSKKEDLEILINQLTSNVDTDSSLIIASVDFSHFQSGQVADFHDRLSRGVIEDFDKDRLFDLEIDSPESLYVLLSYLQEIDAQKNELVFHTNSSYLLNKADEPGTSHLGYYFLSGDSTNHDIINMHFFGDLMLDRYVKLALEKNGLNYILEDIAGAENRFFMGSDIVSANLEGALTKNGEHYDPELSNDFAIDPKYIKQLKEDYYFNYFNLANNHASDQGNKGLIETSENLKKMNIAFAGCPDATIDECTSTNLLIGDSSVAMMGLSMVYRKIDIDKTIGKIEKLKNENDLIVIQVHWGEEYQHEFNNEQQNIAHQLIDAGGDIIIGHHPHVVQGMEIYKNKPIFYSLGNFVFDQYFSQDTQEGLSIGLSYDSNAEIFSIYLFPIKSIKDKLYFLNNKEKQIFYKDFISWSSLENKYIQGIKSGVLQIK